MKNWTPLDHIILILTVTVCTILLMAGVAIPVIINLMETKGDLILVRPETVKLIFTALASFVAIISMYVGARIQQSKDKKNNDSA